MILKIKNVSLLCNKKLIIMNLETVLNNLLKIIYENPEKLDIKYSNIDGKESLVVNGEEQLTQFNDYEIKEKIAEYKQNIEDLDSCVFVEAIESLEDELNLKEVNDLFNQKSFSQADANLADDMLIMLNTAIVDTIDKKIDELEEIRDKFL